MTASIEERRKKDRERKRGEHRHRAYSEDRAIQTRARNRATAALVRRYKAEFEALYDEKLDEVAEEMAELARLASERGVKAESGVVRLRTGTRPADEKPVDRLRDGVSRCPRCQALHEAGHKCDRCGDEVGLTDRGRDTLNRMVCAVCSRDGRARSEPCVDPQGRRRGAHSFRLQRGEAS